MPAANIKVNGVLGSDTDVPINTVVQLDNLNIGGETTYTWSILDQPPLTPDGLSAVNIQNPTFTPKKEGTYYIRLVVNQGLPSEQQDRVVVAVLQLKTLERIPAAGETAEADSSLGWAGANNSYLRRIDTLLGDPGQHVGVNASGGVLTRGDVLRASTTSTIKAGLPGQELLPGFSKALATTLGEVDEPLVVCEGHVDGSASVANGALMKVRFLGRYASNVGGGVAVVGDAVYVTDTGTLSLVAGTVRRKVGSAMTAGATYDVWFAGVGGEDITPIDRGYLVYGNPGTLTNAHRVDGASATPGASGGNSYLFKSADAATVPVTIRSGPASAQNLLNMQNSAGSPILNVTDIGSLVWSAFTLRQFSANIFDLLFGANVVLRVDRISNTILKVVDDTAFIPELLLTANAGSTQMVVGADDSVPRGYVGTTTSAQTDLMAGGTTWWILDTGGDLHSSAATRIRGVADPALAQDVATKNYIDVTFVAATHTWSALQTFSAGIVVTAGGAAVTGTAGAAGAVAGASTFTASGTLSTTNSESQPLTTIAKSTTAGPNDVRLNVRTLNDATAAIDDWTDVALGLSYDVDATVGSGGSLYFASAGARMAGGTAATGATPQNVLELTNGNLKLSGAAPDSTVAVANTLTPANIAKGYIQFTANGVGGISNDTNRSFNIASITITGGDAIITWAAPFASANYLVIPQIASPAATVAVKVFVQAQSTTTVTIRGLDGANAQVSMATNSGTFTFHAFGAQ